MNVNEVFIGGNLTRDPRVVELQNDNKVAHISVATHRRWKNREGEAKEETTFVDCEAYGKTAELIEKFFTKGKPIFVRGRLKLDQWETDDGQKRSKLGVVVDNFEFVGSKSDNNGSDDVPI